MALFDKLNFVAEARKVLLDSGIDSITVVMDKVISPTEAISDGHRMILAGTNNYLGLTFDPMCIEAAVKALREEGTGTTGSRVANGTYSGHVGLERELADFFGCDHVIVFSTGYVANLGIISALTRAGDVILIDADCHASIYDGCRMSGADILRFRHNDVEDLGKRLHRLGEQSSNALIIVEGIYSMLGDKAPLKDIVEAKRRYGAYLLVDEAHSLGVLGEHGRGLSEEAGVLEDVDFIVGTFSKSLGAIGGYCASKHPELDLLRYASRPYMFTASPSPSIIASTRSALKILRSRPELRHQLWENAKHLYRRLQDSGYLLGPEPSPIIAVRFKKREHAVSLWHALIERGIYVNLVLPPATPDGGSLLRCSVSAGHDAQQITRIGDAFEALFKAEYTESENR
jgi:8-amino-7-oxononanoate synthase